MVILITLTTINDAITMMSLYCQVFDITTLQIFSPHELDYLLCGRRELWEVIL